jgi:hypothetical protein
MCSRFHSQFHHQFQHITQQQHHSQGPAQPPTTAVSSRRHHISYPNISKIEGKISCACHDDDVLTAHTHFLPWTTLGTKSLESAKFKGWCLVLPCMHIPNLSTPPRKLLTPPLYKMASHINWTFRVLSVRHGQTMCHCGHLGHSHMYAWQAIYIYVLLAGTALLHGMGLPAQSKAFRLRLIARVI